MKVQQALESVPLLQWLPQERKTHILEKLVLRIHSRGDVIIRQGSEVDTESEFAIIQEGKVSVTKDGVLQCELGPGNCFGELALLSGKPRAATVMTVSESVRLLTLGRGAFCKALTEMPPEAATKIAEGWSHTLLTDMKQEMELIRGTLRAQAEQDVAAKSHVVQATELDIMSLEEAVTDANELASAAWRALKICCRLIATRQTASSTTDTHAYMRVYLIIARFVRKYRARKALKAQAEFAAHEDVITRFQSRIRGFLARRRIIQDEKRIAKKSEAAVESDVESIVDSQVEFWDWPRVLEHCYEWHVDKDAADEPRQCLYFPEILLQKMEFAKKMNNLKQALHGWNELFTIMDSDSSGKVNPDELKEALFAFSCMGLIAEPPKMQPLNQDQEPFIKISNDIECVSPRRSMCSRMRTKRRDDKSGAVGPFAQNEVILLGGEGVPMLGCWALDLEFEYSPAEVEDQVSFHCLVKSYAGDAIVARTSSVQGLLTIFIAPKTMFDEETDVIQRLSKHFETLDPGSNR
jgi:CRP-like cAMP-binding protein